MHTNSRCILVVGGAGYIGSHMVLALQAHGYKPIVLDNLSKGHRDAVNQADLIVGDLADTHLLNKIFTSYPIAAVMHFASMIEVAESVRFPGLYYQNNVAATLQLLDVMLRHNVKTIIYSSTAAVYGDPQYIPMNEAHPLMPVNPYGRSKRMVEEILKDYSRSDGLNYAILRYFNAAGSDPEGRIGECHLPESHLIPILLQAAAGLRDDVTIYGRDYPTEDGTCIRDYVHVNDLCDAHLLAMQHLIAGRKNILCNLGTGKGVSVQEVVNLVKRITGRDFLVHDGVRRLGDPAVLVADASLAKRELNWRPQYTDLSVAIRHAWQFMHNLIVA